MPDEYFEKASRPNDEHLLTQNNRSLQSCLRLHHARADRESKRHNRPSQTGEHNQPSRSDCLLARAVTELPDGTYLDGQKTTHRGWRHQTIESAHSTIDTRNERPAHKLAAAFRMELRADADGSLPHLDKLWQRRLQRGKGRSKK